MGKLSSAWRTVALVLGGVLFSAVTPAYAEEYPCFTTAFSPKNQKEAEAGARKAKLLAAEMAAEYRQKFTLETLTDIETMYGSYFTVRRDWISVKREGDTRKAKLTVENTVTHAMWPSFHADFIEALAIELDALDYRTVTPTCPTRFDSSPDLYKSGPHYTFFMWWDGTIGKLEYQYDGFASRKAMEKLIKLRAKKGNGFTMRLILTGMPLLPTPYTAGGLPKDPNDPNYRNVLDGYRILHGLGENDVIALNQRLHAFHKSREELWRSCLPKSPQASNRIGRTRCLGGPILSNLSDPTRFHLGMADNEKLARLAEFQTWVDDFAIAYGTMAQRAAWKSAAKYRAMQSQWAADERRARARRRANNGDSILAGIAAGLNNAAGSMARDNQRAASAANGRFRAQYGCAPGQCSSTSAGGSATAVGTTQSPSSPSGTRPANITGSTANRSTSPRETKQMNFSESAIYKDGKALRSDAEMCAKISVGESYLGGAVLAKEACSCSDKSMGRKLRVCEVRFSYSSAVINPEAAKKGSDAR